MSERERVVYEFGPLQLDASQRLLFKDAQVVPIFPKTLETLLILVANQGQLLEKERLIKLIWPNTFVEESNLAIQISQLRKILTQEMGSDPIATIPKRGYRFVAPVRRVDAAAAAAAAAIAAVAPQPPAVVPEVVAPARFRWWAIAGAAVVLVVLVIGVALWRMKVLPAAGSLSEKDSLLLADVQNETGEAVFDSTLRQALSIQLEQSPFLSLISDQQIQHTLSMMQQPKTARLTPELAWEICQRTGGAAVIYSSLGNLADQYILGLRAINCRTGDSLANRQIAVQGKDHVLQAVDEGATELRTRLGESLAQVSKYNTPIEQATTPSLVALEAYSIGWLMNYRRGDSASALSFFQRAIQIDPDFAMAHAALGQAYSNLYEPGQASEALKRAYDLRERVSEREKFYIESRYERLVTGDLEKARQINEQWAQVYPREPIPHSSLALIDRFLGQYERALSEATEALRLSPDSAQSYANLAFSYLLLNRLDQAKRVADAARARNLDSPLLHLGQYYLAGLQGDRATEAQLDTWSMGQAGVEDRFLQQKALQYAYFGQIDRALESSQRAISSAQRSGAKETAAGYAADWAVFEALIGNSTAADHAAAEALQLADDRDTQYGAALAFAMSGENERAQGLVESLAQAFPVDTAVQSCFLPTVRAVMALNAGNANQAIRLLETAKPYELGKVTALYPVYIRGKAYLASQRPREAAAEFQKIIDLPGVVIQDPIGALARLQLARAYELAGAAEKSRSAYRDFLALWHEASPETPILVAATTELARLQ